MRRLALATIIAAFCMGGTAIAAPVVDRGGDSSNIRFVDQTPGDATRVRPEDGERERWFRFYVLMWEPVLPGFCMDTRWTRDQGYAEANGSFNRRFDTNTGAPYLECPATAVAVPSPQQMAADVWQHVENLPVPALDIEPDHAITGKPVYLQIRGQRVWAKPVDNPIGDDVTITATPEYVIDWGDPNRPAPTRTKSPGGPWPDGDVTHTYTDTATAATIRVTAKWTATWVTAGGQRGTLTTLSTQAAPLTLEVRQLQAVRRR